MEKIKVAVLVSGGGTNLGALIAAEKKGIIMVTSNRGLAGGYNSNVVKLITNGDFKKEELFLFFLRYSNFTMIKKIYKKSEDVK